MKRIVHRKADGFVLEEIVRRAFGAAAHHGCTTVKVKLNPGILSRARFHCYAGSYPFGGLNIVDVLVKAVARGDERLYHRKVCAP
jgi:hypothetical protein